MEQQAQSALPVPAVAYKPNWRKWWAAGFGKELLPIIPIDATLSPASKVTEANLGKVPGLRLDDGTWVGLVGKWAEKLFPTARRLQEWMKMGAGVGIQARKINCADVDANDRAVADAIVEIVVSICGNAPFRFRDGSPRVALMYRADEGATNRKWRIVFVDDRGVEHAFEWLGYGQYWNVDALHPSGTPYKWSDPHPCELGIDNITVVTAEQIAQLCNAIIDYVDMMGWTLKASTDRGAGSSADTKKIGEGDVAPTTQLVLDVLAAAPCNDETFQSRDEFVNVLRAIKASLGPTHQEHWPAVLEWALHYPGSEPDYIEKIWESFDDSALGWGFLSAWAHGLGFSGDAQHDFDDGSSSTTTPAAIPGPETALERMLARYVWCTQIERYVDLETNTTRSAKAFNAKNVDVADFGRGGMNSAEAVFQNADEARKADIMTYRPGQEHSAPRRHRTARRQSSAQREGAEGGGVHEIRSPPRQD